MMDVVITNDTLTRSQEQQIERATRYVWPAATGRVPKVNGEEENASSSSCRKIWPSSASQLSSTIKVPSRARSIRYQFLDRWENHADSVYKSGVKIPRHHLANRNHPRRDRGRRWRRRRCGLEGR